MVYLKIKQEYEIDTLLDFIDEFVEASYKKLSNPDSIADSMVYTQKRDILRNYMLEFFEVEQGEN